MWETGRTIYGLASYFFTSHEQSFTENTALKTGTSTQAIQRCQRAVEMSSS